MTFNGIKKDYLVTLRGKNRPPWAPMRRNLLEMPGKAGAYNEGTDILPRELSIPILIESNSLKHLKELEEDLAAWLVTDEPKELIFDDEPDRTYYAMVKDTFDVNEIVRVGVGMIEFICPDPYKYGQSEYASLTSTDVSTPMLLTNSGTVITPPVFDIALKGSTTYFDIIGENDYMRIGTPVNERLYAMPPKSTILNDAMSSLTGWSNTVGFTPDYAVAPVGTIVSNGFSFSATSFGTGPKWHGPTKIKTLSEAVTDFEVEVNLQLLYTSWDSLGRIEIYLMDSNMNMTGKLTIRDKSAARDGTYIELVAGEVGNSKFLIDERGDTLGTWLNFKGVLRLSRVGDLWTAYAGKISDKGVHSARRYVTWRDLDTKYTRNVKHVIVHIAANGTSPVNSMAINHVKVLKINTLSGDAIPHIGDAGDIFTVDMGKSLILKNGEPYMNKDFGSRFFNLNPGLNSLVLDPPTVIDTINAEWRSRYK